MDHFFAGVYMRRKIRFMAKSQLFGQNPILDYIFRVGGVFPVRRGHHDEEAFMTAHSILDRGGCVLIYAEGGRSRTGELGEPKPGVGRLALESGRAGRPGRDPRLAGRAGVEAARVPEGHRPVRRADHLRPVAEPDPRAAARGRRREVFDRVRAMYVALEENGRKGVVKALQERASEAVSTAPARTEPERARHVQLRRRPRARPARRLHPASRRGRKPSRA